MTSGSDADWLVEADSSSPLTETDYSHQLAGYTNARHPGTFNCLLESTEYREWVKSSPQTLFFFSEPGAGKSVAAALLIQDLINRYSRDELETISVAEKSEKVTASVAYIFFDSLRHEEQSYDNIALCISEQLATTRCVSKRPRYPPWVTDDDDDEPLCILSEVCVSRYLEEQILGHGKQSTVFVILDGLDECTEATRTAVLSVLAQVQRNNVSLNVMATWRTGWAPAIPFQDLFQHVRRLEIYASHQDLQAYLTQNLPFELKSQKDLIHKIVAAADGRFLFAKLYLDLVGSTQSSQNLDYAGSMPTLGTSYDVLYADIMNKIASQTPHRAHVAKSCLPWLTFAKRPLSVPEIQEALTISFDGNPSLGSEYHPVDIALIVSSCGGLARKDCINGTHCIRLLNRTTQDYLRRQLCRDENDVGLSCIQYLLSKPNGGACETDADFKKRLKFNPLYDYAAQYWGEHMQSIRTPLLSDARIREFLTDRTMWEGALQAEYTAATMRLKGHEGGRDISIRYPRITEAIHLATRAGAANLVASLLAKNDGSNFINCRDNNGCTALSYAASAGNVAILEILLANPLVDVDKRDYEGRTPIFYAAENGHALVVSRLLGHGANPNWKDLDGATPLWFAVQRDHVTVVKVLMESGKLSNLSSRQGPVTTTLAYALKNGFHEISEMIGGVDGIDPYACTEHGSTTVLGLAIHSGHESIALKLIEKHGTGQHSDDRQPGVRLLADAAYIGSTKLVESLLTIHKVDPNVTWMDEDSHNPHGLTPIMIAAQKGHGSVVRLLLDDKSIQLNKTHDFGTALSLAAANGFRDIVEMLMVDGRIDINQKNRKENTPLSLAAKDAHEDVVEALLKSDTIDANCRDYRGRTPLLKAAKGRYLGPNGQQIYDGVAVRLVSDARVDPNSRDNDGHTSLYYAAKHRLLGLVEAIHRHSNADMGLQDEEPPISAAIEYGHVDVVRAFLKTGHVDVNRPVKYEGRYLERSILSSFESTLLSIAANKGREGIVDLLLSQSGIEPHKPDADGLTPLAMAALGGSEAQVDRLLKVKVVDPNSRDLRGRTPLHMAVRSPHPMGAIQALLRAKDIDMDPFDSQGMTPLSTLCRYNARAGLESINLLLACSTVNPDSKDAAGRTPLSWAVDTNDDEAEFNIRMKIIRRLLQIQAVNPNVEDGEGLTPLLRAIRGNHANELVRVLLEREDLDVQQPSMDGLTPMAFAKRTGDAAVISILRKKGALEEENQGPTDASDCDSDVERAMESQIILTTREESSSSRSSSQTRDSSSISERSAASYDWIEMSAQLSRSIVLPLNAPQQHVTLDKGDDGDMCERCSAIDLEDAFSLRHTDPRGRVIAKLGDVRRAWMARDCPMCRLIGAMGSRLQIPIDSDGGEEDSYEFALVALSSTGTWLCQNLDTSWQHFLHHWTDTMVLTLVPHALYEKFNGLGTDEFGRRVFEAGFIGRLGSNCEYGTSSISIHQVDAKVDYDVAKEWITCCREEHSTRCNPRNLAPIPHFWLIDCATRRIVQQVAQAPLYVALSYVWGLPAVARSGKKDHLEPCDAGLGKDVEAVVEDAISVTLGLGYRFLWVDRYCVLQDGDAKIKGEQLQSMDLVYANADVTLVAIAGQASSAGLPGVRSERPRAPQPSVQIKGHALTLIPPDPAIQIKSSAWMTRGWTYQEGLLSRRRLFFSETEMSFECADLVAREAIRLPSVVQRAMCHRTIRLMKPSWVYSQRRLISRRMGGSDLFDRLADYTRRELTYEHDALNAMLGVLRVYATHKKNPVYRVYGVPIIRDPEIDMASLVGGGHTSNEEASIALVGFMSGLCWTLRRPGVRRPRFPSWSWTGWDGVVNCSPRSPEIVSFANGFEVEVSIVLADGVSSIPWNDYYNRLRDAFNKEGRSGFAFSEYHTLDVTANTTMVRFYRQHDEFTKSTEWHGTVSIGDDIWCGDFELLHEDIPPSSGDNEAGTGSSLRLKLLEDSWLGIVLGSPPPSRCDEKGDVNGTYILVIQETPSSGVGGITHWERVGLLTISYSTIQSNILERRRLRLV